MQLSNIPGKLVLPFANAGGKSTIPVASQIGITAGAASLTDGFPPLTRTPIAAGGVPPSGLDMNGILYEMSAIIRWANAGGGYPFDGTFATDTNVGGYPKGARIMRSDGAGYWLNTTENNVTDPEGAGAVAAGWVPDYSYGAAAVTMTSANVTLTPAQWGKPVIVIVGSLTADLNLIFPDIVGQWQVVNSTTGAFTITAKTAAGTGITLVAGINAVTCDSTSFFSDFATLAAPSGSSLVGYLPAGTGAVDIDVQSKLRESVSVKDFGAVGDGSDQTAAFNKAAVASALVKVPPGNYLISAPTTPATLWVLDPGAVITGLSDLNDGQIPTASINNLSRLTGRVVRYQNTSFGAGMLVGSSDPWMEQYIRPSSLSRAEFAAISPYGQIAITGASKISDNPTTVGTDMACIGGNFYAINDRAPVGAETTTAYAVYAEARRRPGGGAAFGAEYDIANQGPTVPLTPNSPLSYAEYSGGIIINSGAGLSPGALYPASFGLLFGSNGSSFQRGIVFNDGSVDSGTLEAMSMPIAYKLAWYVGGNVNSYMDHASSSRLVDDASNYAFDNVKRRHGSGSASASLDTLYRHNFMGYTGSADYVGSYYRVLQRSAFSSGHANFSFDIAVQNSDGTESQVSLNGLSAKSWSPGTDNSLSLGVATFRWSTVYAATGTINTSDAREKQQIRPLLDAEKSVALRCKSLIRAFKFNDAVEQKGDKARIHFGVIAQDVKAAFEAEGLAAEDYALLCYDEWPEQAEQIDEDGKQIPAHRSAGSRYGIRYEELIAFILGAM